MKKLFQRFSVWLFRKAYKLKKVEQPQQTNKIEKEKNYGKI